MDPLQTFWKRSVRYAMKLIGKTALVLGAVKGIGKGIAVALARAGANVACTWHDWPESLEDLQSEMATTGTPHLIQQIDLTDTEKIPGLIKTVTTRFRGLDILINNIERGGWPIVPWPLYPRAVGP